MTRMGITNEVSGTVCIGTLRLGLTFVATMVAVLDDWSFGVLSEVTLLSVELADELPLEWNAVVDFVSADVRFMVAAAAMDAGR